MCLRWALSHRHGVSSGRRLLALLKHAACGNVGTSTRESSAFKSSCSGIIAAPLASVKVRSDLRRPATPLGDRLNSWAIASRRLVSCSHAYGWSRASTSQSASGKLRRMAFDNYHRHAPLPWQRGLRLTHSLAQKPSLHAQAPGTVANRWLAACRAPTDPMSISHTIKPSVYAVQ